MSPEKDLHEKIDAYVDGLANHMKAMCAGGAHILVEVLVTDTSPARFDQLLGFYFANAEEPTYWPIQ